MGYFAAHLWLHLPPRHARVQLSWGNRLTAKPRKASFGGGHAEAFPEPLENRMWPHPTPLNALMRFLWVLFGTKASAQGGFQLLHTKAQVLQKCCRQSSPSPLLALPVTVLGELSCPGISCNKTCFTAQHEFHALSSRKKFVSDCCGGKTDPERWNPAPSGQCQGAHPADSTLHETQVSRALLMYKNTVRRLPASGGSWSWQKFKTASARSQVSTDI